MGCTWGADLTSSGGITTSAALVTAGAAETVAALSATTTSAVVGEETLQSLEAVEDCTGDLVSAGSAENSFLISAFTGCSEDVSALSFYNSGGIAMKVR